MCMNTLSGNVIIYLLTLRQKITSKVILFSTLVGTANHSQGIHVSDLLGHLFHVYQ